MENKKTWKLKISKFELVAYIITGAFALWGFVYMILGLLANNLPIHSDQNYLKQASDAIKQTFGLDFLGWGIIILAISILAMVIVMLACAGKKDKTFEKEQRRAARLMRNKPQVSEPQVVEGEVAESK